MLNLIDAVGRNFERLLRWIYPGGLFLVLLRLARPSDFAKLSDVEQPWGLVVGGLVAGVMVYLLQGYFVNQVVSVIFISFGWDINTSLECSSSKNENRLTQLIDGMAQNAQRRWKSKEENERLSNWLDYAWGVQHALSLTGWLVVFFIIWSEDGSRLHWYPDWPLLVIPIIMLVAALYFHALLVRIRIDDK